MKSQLAPDIKSKSRLMADTCRRIATHWTLIAEELERLEEVHGFSGITLPHLSESEQLCVGANGRTQMQAMQGKNRAYLELGEVAEFLTLDMRSLRRLRADPNSEFPAAFQFGAALRFKRADIEAWIERQRSAP